MTVGLGGTVTLDDISYESGRTYRGIGGILYQAAVFCALGQAVNLYTNLGQDLVADFDECIRGWPTLCCHAVHRVPGPGNRIHLHYPENGERVEILESAVPPLEKDRLLDELAELDLLFMTFNSGFDLERETWRQVIEASRCPVWLDIHSLTLERTLKVPRGYRAFTEWREWARGATYLQANRQEVAASLGHPDEQPTFADIDRFGRHAQELGIETVFVTLGEEGVMVMTVGRRRLLRSFKNRSVTDTTGCGDVFGAAAASRLLDGEDPVQAARFGLRLATAATAVVGVEAVHTLARRMPKG